MKKILILGGSHRDIPLIRTSQDLGYFVITLGDRAYYLGHQFSDKYYQVDFNDLPKVREIIENENIDYLLPGSGEESYLRTVQLSEELGICNYDSLDIAQIVHNKWKFKTFCLENGISTPTGSYHTSKIDLDSVQLPVIVKPTNLSGGRGVEVARTQKELRLSIDRTRATSNEIFLEDFIEGELIAYSVLLKDQKVAYAFIGKDDTYKNDYLITSAYPIKLLFEVQKRLKEEVEKIAKGLLLVDGMFHLQVIVKNEVPFIIDVTRRIPGDLYPYLIEYCDGVEYSRAVVKAYLGESFDNEIAGEHTENFVIRHCVMSDRPGTLKGVQVEPELQSCIIYRMDLMKEGCEIKNFLTDQIAIFFIKLEMEDSNIVGNINSLIHPILI